MDRLVWLFQAVRSNGLFWLREAVVLAPGSFSPSQRWLLATWLAIWLARHRRRPVTNSSPSSSPARARQRARCSFDRVLSAAAVWQAVLVVLARMAMIAVLAVASADRSRLFAQLVPALLQPMRPRRPSMAVTMVSGDEDGGRLTGDDVELGDDGVAGSLACQEISQDLDRSATMSECGAHPDRP